MTRIRMGIMQPYFFPHPAHFSLIAACDQWIVFDLTQYTPRSWMNRNRIQHPDGGHQWLSLPLARSSIHIRIHEAALANIAAARRTILGRLGHYRRAPHYPAIRALVEETFDTADPSLTRLNARGLQRVCHYLGLPFQHRIASSLALHLPDPMGPGDWAPAICEALGATTYINPPSGQALFNPADFARRGIDLQFLHPTQTRCDPGLSILHTLMHHPPQAIRNALQSYTLQVPEEGNFTPRWTPPPAHATAPPS